DLAPPRWPAGALSGSPGGSAYDAIDLEHRIGAHQLACGAAGAALVQDRIAIAGRIDLTRHLENARRARCDAELAALAAVDIDHERSLRAAHGAFPSSASSARTRSCSCSTPGPSS